MASGTRLRKSGERVAAPVKRAGSARFLDQTFGLTQGPAGEHRLNIGQVHAIDHIFNSNPAVQAARTVLIGQLLGSGISLRKDGELVELTAEFQQHLDEHWTPFAQGVIESFLKWGMVAVSYETLEEDARRAAILIKRQRLEEAQRGGRSSKAARAVESQADRPPPLTVPIVPPLGTYEIAYRHGGRAGYMREFYMYSNAPGEGTQADEEARVFVRQQPDSAGNINSPMAAIFDTLSMVSSLNELALIAEASRARPRITTQVRKKDGTTLDPGGLFFDQESREVQAGSDMNDNAANAKALQLQQALCKTINVLQTKSYNGMEVQGGSFSVAGGSSAGKAPAPPEAQPSLFVVPKDQEVAPAGSTPESRGDLEALTRLSVEQVGAAFGVPSDLIYSGKFASKSSNQLSLLNTTVSQLAKNVNSVLTMAYRDVYAENGENVGSLELLTSPLSSSEEVLALYSGGLLPVEVAMKASLSNIGATKAEIDKAIEDASEKQKKAEAQEKKMESANEKDNALSLEMKKVDIEIKKKQAKESSQSDSSAGGAQEKDDD